jgi:dihydrofolate synthase/folylpolyglutamate synthase
VLSPLVSVITSIGLDHQVYLGPTLAHIAREKGGIIKPEVPVIVGRVDAESGAILHELAQAHGSPVMFAGKDFTISDNASGGIDYRGLAWQLPDMRVGLRGRVQRDNAAVALATLEQVCSSFPVAEEQLRSGLQETVWPGRLEVVSRRPLVILDGAHNPQAVDVLAAELPALLEGKRVKLLFGVMRDKDWRAMISTLARVATEVVVTRVQQARAEDPEVLQAAFAPLCPVRVIPDVRQACQHLVAEAGTNEAIVVCGSLFLVGEVYPLFSPSVFPTLPWQRVEEG